MGTVQNAKVDGSTTGPRSALSLLAQGLRRWLRPAQAMPPTATPPRLLIEALEPRVMLSADTPDLPREVAAAVATAVREMHDIRVEMPGAQPAPGRDAAASGVRAIAFVDAGVADHAQLAGLLRDARDVDGPAAAEAVQVDVVDPGRDGLRQVADVSQGVSGLQAVHVFAHGWDALQLRQQPRRRRHGQRSRGHGSRPGRTHPIRCRPAALCLRPGRRHGGPGIMSRMAALTGADVAASTDRSGSAALAATGFSKCRRGRIEYALPASLLGNYNHLLAAVHGTAAATTSVGAMR